MSVNLLAAQWGDLYTNVTDLPWGSMADPTGRRIVVVGTENRQNQLGHLALLGAHRPIHPFASGGPPEGRLAGALDVLLADWAIAVAPAGGLVVAAHFRCPTRRSRPTSWRARSTRSRRRRSRRAGRPGRPRVVSLPRPGLSAADRAGTDKMSAEVPVGAVRAYVHLLSDEPLSFNTWAAAVRAGRTFVTSGPILELTVDGHERATSSGCARQGGSRRRSGAGRPADHHGPRADRRRTGGAAAAGRGVTSLELHQSVEIGAGAWIAARSRSADVIESAFTTSMAAHTSPVYVEVDGRPFVPKAEAGAVVERIIEGARTWVDELAAVAEPAERTRMVTFLDASLAALRDGCTADAEPPGFRRVARPGWRSAGRSSRPRSRRRPGR
jgi:hypothetical protein